MNKIRVALAGVGNCASSLVQGLEYYKGRNEEAFAGLMHARIGDWGPSDIEVVAAFDIDRRKVGKPVEEAIFAEPNCTKVFQKILPVSGVVVQMGPVLDGVASHMADYADDEAFRPSDEEPVNVVQVLKDAKAEVLVCYMPVVQRVRFAIMRAPAWRPASRWSIVFPCSSPPTTTGPENSVTRACP